MTATTITPRHAARAWTTRLCAALAGLLAAALALGVGDLFAGLFRDAQSPRDAVGAEFIDHTPIWLKNFAVEQFGTNDKVALRVGMLVVIGLLGLVLGAVAWRRRWIGVVGIGAFGVHRRGRSRCGGRRVTRSTRSRRWSARVAGIIALLVLLDRLQAHPEAARDGRAPRDDSWSERLRENLGTTERKAAIDRRGFFMVSGVVAVGAAAAGGAGKWLKQRFDVSASRANVVLPAPASAAGAAPAGVQSPVEGVSKFVTPNTDFYRIDTALTVPQVPAESWRLKVHGHGRPRARDRLRRICSAGARSSATSRSRACRTKSAASSSATRAGSACRSPTCSRRPACSPAPTS